MFKLLNQHVHRFLILNIMCFTIKIEQHFSRIDKIEIISSHIILIYFSFIVDYRIPPLFYIIEVAFITSSFPHVKHRTASYSLGIPEEKTLTMIQLPCLRETAHL